ncbi:hypothetical protein [Nonomuraea sp. NPDC049480]|uniref:hypothetical protein n=1 Tax=Nonomuraea sp. NPDC049480 TaxID=3364353 RepID=UPI003799DB7B
MTDLGNTTRPASAGRIWRWLPRVVLPAVAVVITLQMAEKRGVAMGVFAALLYGGFASLSWFAPERVMRWSSRHPVLDGLLFAPILFGVLAYLTPLPLWACLGISAAGTAALFGVRGWLQGRRKRPGR